jgi:structural maintenance of chromosomes protein 6
MPADIVGLQSAKEVYHENLMMMFGLTTLFIKEAEAEKAHIMQQFEDAIGRQAVIDEEQNVLLTELNKVKTQIQNFEEARGKVLVRFTCGCFAYVT